MYNSKFSMRRCPHIGEAEASSICANPARGGRASHLEPGGKRGIGQKPSSFVSTPTSLSKPPIQPHLQKPSQNTQPKAQKQINNKKTHKTKVTTTTKMSKIQKHIRPRGFYPQAARVSRGSLLPAETKNHMHPLENLISVEPTS